MVLSSRITLPPPSFSISSSSSRSFDRANGDEDSTNARADAGVRLPSVPLYSVSVSGAGVLLTMPFTANSSLRTTDDVVEAASLLPRSNTGATSTLAVYDGRPFLGRRRGVESAILCEVTLDVKNLLIFFGVIVFAERRLAAADLTFFVGVGWSSSSSSLIDSPREKTDSLYLIDLGRVAFKSRLSRSAPKSARGFFRELRGARLGLVTVWTSASLPSSSSL
jgi:hypothetical protein